MTIQNYLRVLREQWLVVLLATVLGLAGAVVAYAVQDHEYTAETTMYVSTSGREDAISSASSAQLAQLRVTSYVELAGSRRVSEEVIERLGLSLDPADLSSRITASTPLESVIIYVQVVDTDPQRAADLANEVGEVFSDLAAELDSDPRLELGVVQLATVPTTPSSPGLVLVLAFGLLGGLAVGYAGARARNAFDTSIKTLPMLHEVTGVANLASLPFDAQVRKRPLTQLEQPTSYRSETFRQLRTNLQYHRVDDPPITILVTSAVPGEGKTTIVVNLATALAAGGKRVLVIDADLRRPRVADLLGLDGTTGLTGVLSNQVPVDAAIQRWDENRFDILASGDLPPEPSELLASKQMEALLHHLRGWYDVILIDSPALLPVTDSAVIAAKADATILVCQSKRTTRPQVKRAIEALAAVSARIIGTVFTMVPPSKQRFSAYLADGSVASRTAVGRPIDGDPAGRSDGSAQSDDSAARNRSPRSDSALYESALSRGPAPQNGLAHQNGTPLPNRAVAPDSRAVQNGAGTGSGHPDLPAPSRPVARDGDEELRTGSTAVATAPVRITPSPRPRTK